MTAVMFPSTRDDPRWPGAWKWGVDYSGDSERVIAVQGNDEGDWKYDVNWIGPIDMTTENAAMLEHWAERTLHIGGGYVHLFPADGDATVELRAGLEAYDTT